MPVSPRKPEDPTPGRAPALDEAGRGGRRRAPLEDAAAHGGVVGWLEERRRHLDHLHPAGAHRQRRAEFRRGQGDLALDRDDEGKRGGQRGGHGRLRPGCRCGRTSPRCGRSQGESRRGGAIPAAGRGARRRRRGRRGSAGRGRGGRRPASAPSAARGGPREWRRRQGGGPGASTRKYQPERPVSCTSRAMSGRSKRRLSFQQGCRPWLTSRSAPPRRKRSPRRTPDSVTPSTTRFSPKPPGWNAPPARESRRARAGSGRRDRRGAPCPGRRGGAGRPARRPRAPSVRP